MALFGGLRRLRTQLAAILALAMLPAGVIAVYQAVSIARDSATDEISALEGEAYIRAAQERETLIEVRESLRTVARLVSKSDDPRLACEGAAERLAGEHPWLLGAFAVGNDGKVTCGASQPLDMLGLPEWDEFQRMPRFTIGPPRKSRVTGREVAVAYYPVPNGTNEFFAVGVGIDVAFLRSLALTDPDGSLKDLPFALVGNDGIVVALRRTTDVNWLPADVIPLLGPAPRTVEATGRDGLEHHFITNPLAPGQLWAVTAAPAKSFWASLASEQAVLILSPILLWLIAVIVVFVAINRLVTRHINKLSRIAARIGRGELDIEVKGFDEAPTEIASLGGAVSAMAHNLAEREGRLRDVMNAQKSLLLEVHHRVKNNLQMISSLVNIQLRRATDARESSALQIVQDRIHSLALVHQNLYATERLDHVALHELLRDLSRHIAASLASNGPQTEFDFVLDKVTVDAEVATPVALFLTEALGNVFKHADTGGSARRIRVTLADRGDRFLLTIANPVSGAQAAASRDLPPGLGSRLMDGFASQLGGQITRAVEGGDYRISLEAPVTGRTGGAAFRIRNRDARRSAASAAG